MNWSKAKSILILLFLLINLFLVVTLIRVENDRVRISPETVQHTITLLQQNGIQIDEKLIPKKNTPVHCYDVESILASPSEFQASVQSALQAAGYGTDTAQMEVTVNQFSIRVTGTIRPYDKIDEQKLRGVTDPILDAFGIPYQDYTVRLVSQEGALYTVELCPEYKKQTFYGVSLRLQFTQDGVKELYGNWLQPKMELSDSYSDTNLPSVLVDFCQNPDRKQGETIHITAIGYLNYVNPADFSEEYKIIQSIPVYTLTTDEGRTYLYDARSNIASSAKYIGYY